MDRQEAVRRLQDVAIRALNADGGDPGFEEYWRASVVRHAETRPPGHVHVIVQGLATLPGQNALVREFNRAMRALREIVEAERAECAIQ